MSRLIRSLFVLPLAIVALVATIALVLSIGSPRHAQGQTAPPTSTVPPESPLPTPTQPSRPPVPTPRPIQVSDSRVRANGWLLEKVIGNRLSSTIYGVAIAPRFYRSDNNGQSWTLVRRNPEITEFLMGVSDPEVLYSAVRIDCSTTDETNTLYRSANAGLSWTALNQGFALQPLIVDPADANTVIAAGCDGLYWSQDGGWSWSLLSTVLDDEIWHRYQPQEIEAVYDSEEEPSLQDLYLLASNDDGYSILLFSDDAGVTWSRISPMDAELGFIALTTDPDEIGRVWLSTENGVWSTEDQGQFWGLSVRGLDIAIEEGLTDIVLDSAENLYLGSGLGVYGKRTTETLWQQLGNSAIQRQSVVGLLYSETADNLVWLNSENGVYRLPALR